MALRSPTTGWATARRVVLVGAAWNDRMSAAPLAQLLASDFSVYTYDRRGRGDSGDTAPYAVEREFEDLEAVIDAAGGSAYAFGVSSGAALALEATAAGVPISKLAMYEPPYIVDDSRTADSGRLRRAPGSARLRGQAQRDPPLLHDRRGRHARRDGGADGRVADGEGDGAAGSHGCLRRPSDAARRHARRAAAGALHRRRSPSRRW